METIDYDISEVMQHEDWTEEDGERYDSCFESEQTYVTGHIISNPPNTADAREVFGWASLFVVAAVIFAVCWRKLRC